MSRERGLLEKIVLVVGEPVAALLAALAANYIVLRALGYDPVEVFYIMFSTGYTDPGYLLLNSSPYIATGLAFSVPFLAGVFNIGGEGQLYIGALTAVTVSYVSRSPLVSIVAGALAGALLGAFIGALRSLRNVNEVVSSIMLNWTMYYLVSYIVSVYLYDPYAPYQTRPVPPEATISPYTMFIVALSASILTHAILYRTSIGYMMRVVGRSPRSALYAGIDTRAVAVYSMSLGGLLAGLGGALIPLGVSPHVIDNTMSALYGIGFLGIGVGLLGRNSPLGIVVSALFVSGLIIGGQNVERITGAPPEVVDMVIGIIVVALSVPRIVRALVARGRAS